MSEEAEVKTETSVTPPVVTPVPAEPKVTVEDEPATEPTPEEGAPLYGPGPRPHATRRYALRGGRVIEIGEGPDRETR